MKKQILSAIKVSILAVVLSLGLSYVYAWTAPASNPPAGNVSAPINTSGTAQTKTGTLTVGTLSSTGGISASGISVGTGGLYSSGVVSGSSISAGGGGMNSSGGYYTYTNNWGLFSPSGPAYVPHIYVTNPNGFYTSNGGVGKVLTSDGGGWGSWQTPVVPAGGVTSITAGTGISVSGSTGAVTVTNTAPGGIKATTNVGPVGVNDGGAGWDANCPAGYVMTGLRVASNRMTVRCAQI